jgi:transcriptional regulator with XRE-family HTH domain
MKAHEKYSVSNYGDRYMWTPLSHKELIEFIEVRRRKTNISMEELAEKAGYSNRTYSHLYKGHSRFSQRSFTDLAKIVVDATPSQLEIDLDKQLTEKIEAPAKIEKPIYGVMSIQQMITEIKAAGYKVMRRTEGWEEI